MKSGSDVSVVRTVQSYGLTRTNLSSRSLVPMFDGHRRVHFFGTDDFQFCVAYGYSFPLSRRFRCIPNARLNQNTTHIRAIQYIFSFLCIIFA